VARLVTRGRIEDGSTARSMNSRTPRERTAIAGADPPIRAGSDRLREVCLQHGADALARGTAEFSTPPSGDCATGSRGCRTALRAEGSATTTQRGPAGPHPRRVRIAGDRVTLDFTGTEAQVPGAKNVPPGRCWPRCTTC